MRRFSPQHRAPATDLHVCGACGEPFVVPSGVLEVLRPGARYVVELLCNACGATAVGTYDEDTLEAFDDELERSQRQLSQAADVLHILNSLEEIDAFAAALAADLILPEDF